MAQAQAAVSAGVNAPKPSSVATAVELHQPALGGGALAGVAAERRHRRAARA